MAANASAGNAAPSAEKMHSGGENHPLAHTILRYRFLLSNHQTVVCEISLRVNALQSSDQKDFFLSLGAAALRKQLGLDS